MPEPAGMSLPMMMFSLRPKSLSDLPSMAASVSTRVVSWNDAADSHESVDSDALVMPISSGRPSAGRCRPGRASRLSSAKLRESTRSPGRNGDPPGSATRPGEHLPHDELDVLVVDRHALLPVHLLHLVDEVLLAGPDALDLEDLLRVLRALDDDVAGGAPPAVLDLEGGAERDGVGLLVSLVGDDGDAAAVLLVVDANDARRRARMALPFGRAGLEELHDAGQAVGDVTTGDPHHRCGTCAW